MPITLNLKILAFSYPKAKLVTIIFPRYIHNLIPGITIGALNKDLRQDIAIVISQLNNICGADQI